MDAEGVAARPQGPPAAGDSVISAALRVLHQPDPELKAKWTTTAYELWQQGSLTEARPGQQAGLAPSRPARDDARVQLVSPMLIPRRGKGGSLASRQALLHSLVHIECCAIDLAWDAIARFGADPEYAPLLPRAFFDDFVTVAADESRHFSLLLARLRATGADYGSLPAHDGLWQSAAETAGSLPARLAVEHCTHEARGLDVLPKIVARFRAGGDAASAALLEEVVAPEEVAHCAAGVRWLRHLHGEARRGRGGGAAWAAEAAAQPRVEAWFHLLVRRHFHGPLKPPFNEAARAKAGFLPEWYMPLVVKPPRGEAGAPEAGGAGVAAALGVPVA